MAADLVFIVNPKSANGRTRRQWGTFEGSLRASLGKDFEVVMTERRGHATSLATAALLGGANTVVSVGGDGTLNEVVNGFFDSTGRPWNPEAILAILPVGTGTDFAKTFPTPRSPEALARALRAGTAQAIDMGVCEFVQDGNRRSRYFLNVAEFGSGGAVVDRVNRSWKLFGGRLSFLIAILRTLPRYKNTRVTYEVEGSPPKEVVVNDFVIANGRYFGAGLMPAPSADLTDGLLDIVIFGDINFRTARRNLPALRRGEHLAMKDVTTFRCHEIAIRCENEMIDLDGEFVGRHPVRFAVLPKALWVLAEKGG
jgi:YegS/Rv2252/BmrU family lipid kinase